MTDTPAAQVDPPAAQGLSWSTAVVAIISLMLMAAVVSFALQGREMPPQLVKWQSDHTAAREQAAAEDKLLLVYFTMNNCLPCEYMQRTVFSRGDVAQRVHADFVPVMLNRDTPVGDQLRTAYRVSEYPTFVVVDGDVEILRVVGAMKAEAFTAMLDDLAAQREPEAFPG